MDDVFGASAGGKFVIKFVVERSDAEKQLKDIKAGVDDIRKVVKSGAKEVAEFGRRSEGAFSAMSRSVKNLDIASRITAISTSFMALNEVFGGGGLRMISPILGMMKEVSSVEEAQLRLQRQGNMTLNQSRQVISNVRAMVQYTPFMQDELIGLTEALVQGKVGLENWKNKAGEAITLQKEFTAGTSKMDETTLKLAGNMKVNALSTLADFAALTGNVGEKMPFFVRGMQRAFATGSGILLLDQLNAEARKVLFGEGGAKLKGTAGEAMQRIYKYLQEKGAVGMAAMASSTYAGLMSNFKEIPKNLAIAIAGDPTDPNSAYSLIKARLTDFYKSIAGQIDDPEFLEGLKTGLRPILEAFGKGIELAGKGIAKLAEIIKKNPRLVTIVAGLGGATAIIGSFVAALTMAGIVVGAVAAGIGALVTVLSPLTLIIGTITAALFGGAAAIVAFNINSKGFIDFFDKAKTVVGAVIEAIQNWGGKTTKISGETAKALDDAGLLGFFLDTVNAIRKFQLAFQEVSAVAKKEFGDAGREIAKQLSDIGIGFIGATKEGGIFGNSASGTGGWIQGLTGVVKWLIKMTAAILKEVIPAVHSMDMIFTEVAAAIADALYGPATILKSMTLMLQGEFSKAWNDAWGIGDQTWSEFIYQKHNERWGGRQGKFKADDVMRDVRMFGDDYYQTKADPGPVANAADMNKMNYYIDQYRGHQKQSLDPTLEELRRFVRVAPNGDNASYAQRESTTNQSVEPNMTPRRIEIKNQLVLDGKVLHEALSSYDDQARDRGFGPGSPSGLPPGWSAG